MKIAQHFSAGKAEKEFCVPEARWDDCTSNVQASLRDAYLLVPFPALKCWAIFLRPSGPLNGKIRHWNFETVY